MPGQRTTDIQLPLSPGETPDPSIPGRLQRQKDVALQRTSKAYETPRTPAGDPDATSYNPLRRLASKVNRATTRSMSRSR